MPLTYKKLYHISVTVPQDNGMAKWMVGPIYLTLVRASTQLPIVFLHPWLLFISCPCSTLNILCLLWNVNSTVKVLQCWLLFCVRMMSPVPCALSTMMLCLLKLMKHTVVWSLLLYWRRSTWLGKLHNEDIFDAVVSQNFILNKTCMTMLQCQMDDLFYKNVEIIRNASEYLHAKCFLRFIMEISIHSYLM